MLRRLQVSSQKKINKETTLFIPGCDPALKETLTGETLAGLFHFVMGAESYKDKRACKEYVFVQEDTNNQKTLEKYYAVNNDLFSRLPQGGPRSLSEWRSAQSGWIQAKKILDIFFSDAAEQEYQGLFSPETGIFSADEWQKRKDTLLKKNKGLVEVTDEMLMKEFKKLNSYAKEELKKFIDAWKDKHKDVPESKIKEHLIEFFADVMFMKGLMDGPNEKKWTMLYPSNVKAHIEVVNAIAWLLCHDGHNFQYVMVQFEGKLELVEDGIYAQKHAEKSPSSSPIAIDPNKQTGGQHSPKKQSRTPERNSPTHVRIPAQLVAQGTLNAAFESVMNSRAGVELMMAAAKGDVPTDKATEVVSTLAKQIVATGRSYSPSNSTSSSDGDERDQFDVDLLEKSADLKPRKLSLPDATSFTVANKPLPAPSVVPAPITKPLSTTSTMFGFFNVQPLNSNDNPANNIVNDENLGDQVVQQKPSSGSQSPPLIGASLAPNAVLLRPSKSTGSLSQHSSSASDPSLSGSGEIKDFGNHKPARASANQ